MQTRKLIMSHSNKFRNYLCDVVKKTHTVKCSLINGSKYGFRQRRSCLSNLLKFFENITVMKNKENSMNTA